MGPSLEPHGSSSGPHGYAGSRPSPKQGECTQRSPGFRRRFGFINVCFTTPGNQGASRPILIAEQDVKRLPGLVEVPQQVAETTTRIHGLLPGQ